MYTDGMLKNEKASKAQQKGCRAVDNNNSNNNNGIR
jgi:hypothetical protein